MPSRRIDFPCCKSSTADDTGIEKDDLYDDVYEGGATILKTPSFNSNSKTLFTVEVNSPIDTIQSQRSKDS